MDAAIKGKTRRTIENAIIFAAFWGGAWTLGFLLGFG